VDFESSRELWSERCPFGKGADLLQPGIAILHTVYGVYHLGRKPSGRTPASSASYMLFAAFFDISIVPFYVFGALVSKTQESSWTTVLSNQDLEPILATVVFYLATVGGAFYFISLGVSLYLAVTFRKITKLPPDMNPLEDNLTSRHKRNKSSMSVATTMSEKRLTSPLESKYSSGAAYEDLSRPPTIPFFHTRSGSVDSFSTYKATPPPSRDARHDLPSLKHQVTSDSARSSRSTNDLKRKSQGSAPLNRGSYTEVPLSDNSSQRSPRKIGNIQEAWFTADSLATTKRSRSASPKKASYQPLHQRYDSDDLSSRHAQALEEDLHTPSPLYELDRESPLTEIRNSSGDIADLSPQVSEKPSIREFKAKGYGELKPGTPPIMIGASRQVSSGIDFPKKGGFWAKDRDVSGKLAEEGRGGDGSGWGARFRKVSGR